MWKKKQKQNMIDRMMETEELKRLVEEQRMKQGMKQAFGGARGMGKSTTGAAAALQAGLAGHPVPTFEEEKYPDPPGRPRTESLMMSSKD